MRVVVTIVGNVSRGGEVCICRCDCTSWPARRLGRVQSCMDSISMLSELLFNVIYDSPHTIMSDRQPVLSHQDRSSTFSDIFHYTSSFKSTVRIKNIYLIQKVQNNRIRTFILQSRPRCFDVTSRVHFGPLTSPILVRLDKLLQTRPYLQPMTVTKHNFAVLSFPRKVTDGNHLINNGSSGREKQNKKRNLICSICTAHPGLR